MQRQLAVWGSLLVALSGCAPTEPIRLGVGGDVTTQRRAASGAEVLAETETQTGPRAWLWEISGGPSDAAPSYVLGTMHIAIPFSQALPAPLDEHLYGARSVVMEVDLREAERFFRESAARPPRRPRREWLDRALPREVWALLVAELGDRVPPDVLRQLPPALISNYLMQVRFAEAHAIAEGREPVRGAVASARLDQSIADWAIPSGRPIVPLETVEEALAALEALEQLRPGSTLEALVEVVAEADAVRAHATAMREAYLTLDDAGLLRLLSEELTAEELEVLLHARNRAWMPALRAELDQGRAFVAVGVGHLVGPGSVLAMLHESGYRVRRL